MRWSLDEAVGVALDRLQIANLLRTDMDDIRSPTLCGDFIRSLCFPDLAEQAGLGRALFAEWIDSIGLVDQSNITVVSWVDKTTQPLTGCYGGRAKASEWTEFFFPRPMASASLVSDSLESVTSHDFGVSGLFNKTE